MSDLVAFLTARLDEDEAAAAAALESAGLREPFQVDHWDEMSRDDARHFARWDPARVLREVDAKRRILALQDPAECEPGPYYWLAANAALRALAAVYADHPDYDPKWAYPREDGT
jgi:hypothetical protein